MTAVQHTKNTDSRVVEAAPHPEGEVVKVDEYYMVDPPAGSECFFLPYPGKTHAVFYTASFENDVQINCHSLENWRQVHQFVTESTRLNMTIASTPDQLIADLRKKADKLEQWLHKNPQPAATEFQGMPYAGMRVWVEHPGIPNSLVHVKVTEICVTDGNICIVTEGWKYFCSGHWFWTKEAAEISLRKKEQDQV